ncbi:MAG: immunoglobulin-like domain-containing protein [Halarcobacter ebronensis]
MLVDGKEYTINIPAGETTGTLTFTPENDTFNAKVTNVIGGNFEAVDFDDADININVDSPSTNLKVGITGEYTNVYFDSDHAGFSNSLLTYELDENGNPTNPKLIMLNSDDGLSAGDLLASFGNPDIKFLLIADGADKVTDLLGASLSFDNTTDYPKLIVDGQEIDQTITIFQDEEFNIDGKEHFVIEDNNDGTQTIKIEDLPNNGDKDFDDLIITTERVVNNDIDVTEGFDGYYVIDLKDENGNIIIAQEDIEVTLTYTGTAIDGQDYSKEVTVTIPKGSGQINFDVSTIDDNFYENKENFEIEITSISPDIDTISIDENRDTVNTDIIDDDSHNKDVLITLDSPNNVDENATKVTYTINVTIAPQSDLKVVVNVNDEPREVTIKAGETSATFDLDVREDDKYKDDDDTFNAEIVSHSGGNYEGNVSYNNDDNTFKVIDDVDPIDVTVTAVATSPKVIDVDTEFGEANGIDITAYDTSGNVGTLSVVKGTNHDGFGVQGSTSGSGADSELGYGSNGISEKIVFDFTNDANSLDVAFAWRHNGETAVVKFFNDGEELGYAKVSGGGSTTDATVSYYDINGDLIKSVQAQGGTDRVDLSYTFEFPDANGKPSAFDKVEFSAAGHNDDYLINKISYTEVIDPEITNISTSEGKVTFNIQVDENYPPQGQAKAIVEVNGQEYEVHLNATGRGVLTVDAKDFADLSDVNIIVKEIVGGNYEKVNGSDVSFDLSDSFKDDLSSTDDKIIIDEDTTYTLTETDFGELGIGVEEIKITDLPENGTLYYKVKEGQIVIDKEGNTYEATEDSVVELSENQIISLADIAAGNITFTPNSDSDIDGNFEFEISDGNVWDDTTYTTTIEVKAIADAPTASISVSDATIKVVDSTFDYDSYVEGLKDNTSNTIDGTETYGDQLLANQFNETNDYIDGKDLSDNMIGYKGDDVFLGQEGDDSIYGGHESAPASVLDGNDTAVYRGNFNDYDITFISTGSNVRINVIDTRYNSNKGYQHPSNKDLDTYENGDNLYSIEKLVFKDGVYEVVDGKLEKVETKVLEYDVDISAALADVDGSETLTVKIDGVPNDATLESINDTYNITKNSDGSYSVEVPANTTSITDNLKLTVPENSATDFSLSITARATETNENEDGTNYKETTDSTSASSIIAVGELQTLEFDPKLDNNENVVIVLDISGSMNDKVDSTTRMNLAKEALANMINTYDDLSNVNVKLTTFSTSANSTGWMNAKDAIEMINKLDAKGWTNYEDALFETYHNYSTPNNGETTVYFISDGKPNKENKGASGTANETDVISKSGTIIDTGYINKWNNFLSNNVNTLNVIGIGSGISANDPDLLKVAQNVGNVKTNVTVIEDETQLKDKLVEGLESSVEGNLFEGNVTGHTGDLDILSIQIDNKSYSINDTTNNKLEIDTAAGGKLEVDFETGDYKYSGINSDYSQSKTEKISVISADENSDQVSYDLVISVDKDSATETTPEVLYLDGDIDLGSLTKDLLTEDVDHIELTNTTIDELIIDEESIEDLTDNENILKIFGDSGDKVKLEGGAENWESKGTETDSDGNTFNVYQGTSSTTANVKVLIDDDVSIESDI